MIRCGFCIAPVKYILKMETFADDIRKKIHKSFLKEKQVLNVL